MTAHLQEPTTRMPSEIAVPEETDMTTTSPELSDATAIPATTDLLGQPLTPSEVALLDVYRGLKTLVAEQELAPCAVSNLRVALSAAAVALTDLAIEFEPLTDHGC